MSVEDRASELATKLSVDESVLATELESLLAGDRSLSDATLIVRRRFDTEETNSPVVPTVDVSRDHDTVSVTGVITRAGQRTVHIDDETTVITEGIIADDHGSLPFTLWDRLSHDVGDAVHLTDAGVRHRHGRTELSIDQDSSITPVPDTFDVNGTESVPDSLADLSPGDRDCLLAVTVLSSGPNRISGRGGPTRIRHGVFGDSTARLPFIDWEARPTLSQGTTVRIQNAFIQSFKGLPQINLGRYTDVTAIGGTTVETAHPPREQLSTIARSEGRFDVTTRGTIVDFTEGTGNIRRCETCRRVLRRGTCRRHGETPGVRDLRAKAIVDDGTGVLTALFSTAETAALAGLERDARQVQRVPRVRPATLRQRLQTRAIGTEVRLRGRYRIGDYESILEVRDCQKLSPAPSSRATELLGHIEANA